MATQRELVAFCEDLADVARMTADVRGRAEAVIQSIQRLISCDDRTLAQGTRVLIDAVPQRRTVVRLAREVGANERHVARAFKREFGVCIARYERQQLTRAILTHLANGASVKEITAKLHCSSATVRRWIRASTGHSARDIRTTGRRISAACARPAASRVIGQPSL